MVGVLHHAGGKRRLSRATPDCGLVFADATDAVADALASVDGALNRYRATPDDFPYSDDAEDLIRRLEFRGFQVVRATT